MYSLYQYELDGGIEIKTHSVYRIYDSDNQLLYVGMSGRVLGRIADHHTTKDWFKDVSRIDIQWHSSKKEATAAEAYAIKSEKPLYNRHLNANHRGVRSRKKKTSHFNFALKLTDSVQGMEIGQSVVVKKENAQVAIRHMKAEKGWDIQTKVERYKGPPCYANATHLRLYRMA